MASYSVDPAAISAAADQCQATRDATQDAARLVPTTLRELGDAFADPHVLDAVNDAVARWTHALCQLDDAAASLGGNLQAAARVYDEAAASLRAALSAP